MHEGRRGAADNRVGREVAFAHRNRMTLVAVFSRNKPPGAVPFDRAADGTAELLACKVRRRLSLVEGCRQTLQRFMPEEDETGTVIVVSTGLGDNIDDAGPGTANGSLG